MRKTLLAAALGILTPALAVHAQSAGAWVASLGGGVTVPMSDINRPMKNGYHGVATIGYHKPGARFTWLLDASYHQVTSGRSDQSDPRFYVATARVNYSVSNTIYVLGGVGIFRNEYDQEVNGIPKDFTNLKPHFSFGLGLDVGKFFFVEGRLIYGNVEGKWTVLVPITIGVHF